MQRSTHRGVSGVSGGRWWVGGAQPLASAPSQDYGRRNLLLTGTIPWIANLTAKGKQVASSLCAGQVGAAGSHAGCLSLPSQVGGLGLRAAWESTTRLGSNTPRFRPRFCSQLWALRQVMSLSRAQAHHRHNRPPAIFRRLAGRFQSKSWPSLLPLQMRTLQVHTGPVGASGLCRVGDGSGLGFGGQVSTPVFCREGKGAARKNPKSHEGTHGPGSSLSPAASTLGNPRHVNDLSVPQFSVCGVGGRGSIRLLGES